MGLITVVGVTASGCWYAVLDAQALRPNEMAATNNMDEIFMFIVFFLGICSEN
ncbi:MAG: hypothetical protein L3J24_14530 [Xanthomonadales bacterium]|nr:hypothetical protein [Xanthomonadales bacterium]